MARIKLKKKKSDAPLENESDLQFVARVTEVVDSTETLTAEEEETTSLDALKALRGLRITDNRAYRSGLTRLEENAGSFAALSSDEKRDLAMRFATDYTNILTEFPNFWDRVQNGYENFHPLMVESRKSRFRWCSSLIYNCVVPNVAAVVIGKMVANNLWLLYTEFGVEGTTEGDTEGLYDYVLSTSLSVGAGLLEDITGAMIPGTITEAELISRIHDCLELGIFYHD